MLSCPGVVQKVPAESKLTDTQLKTFHVREIHINLTLRRQVSRPRLLFEHRAESTPYHLLDNLVHCTAHEKIATYIHRKNEHKGTAKLTPYTSKFICANLTRPGVICDSHLTLTPASRVERLNKRSRILVYNSKSESCFCGSWSTYRYWKRVNARRYKLK